MKTKCWKCHGRGWLYDHFLGILTLGLGYLIQAIDDGGSAHPDEVCPICHGKGWLE